MYLVFKMCFANDVPILHCQCLFTPSASHWKTAEMLLRLRNHTIRGCLRNTAQNKPFQLNYFSNPNHFFTCASPIKQHDPGMIKSKETTQSNPIILLHESVKKISFPNRSWESGVSLTSRDQPLITIPSRSITHLT